MNRLMNRLGWLMPRLFLFLLGLAAVCAVTVAPACRHLSVRCRTSSGFPDLRLSLLDRAGGPPEEGLLTLMFWRTPEHRYNLWLFARDGRPGAAPGGGTNQRGSSWASGVASRRALVSASPSFAIRPGRELFTARPRPLLSCASL